MSSHDVISDSFKKAQQFVSGSGAEDKQVQLDTAPRIQPTDNDRQTTDAGVRQSNTDHWLRVQNADTTGPMLLEDNVGREKIHRFDHERIPERVVHARGSGAFGTFRLFESAEDVTYAPILTDTSRETSTFVRFSTVLGNSGSADSVRDARGFAVRMYTEEGNWDIVGNNIPVFFIQDAIKFPDLVHAAKPEPHNAVPQAQSAHNNFWDFMYGHKEATHMYMWAMSDRAIPRSFRMMQGFGVNTFCLYNAKGERSFVKFIWTPELGVHSLVWDEALKIGGQDPDFHRKDLWAAIEAGVYPKWKFGIQVIPDSREHEFDFDVLDATKVWPEDLVPVRYIGELELNRNPDEYFPQTEQIAFCTSHVVPGIGFSDDPLLQGRNFSYFDTQITRLGINWQELPINRPVCPVRNFNRDGQLRHTINKGTVNYWPNRFGTLPPASKGREEGGYVDFNQKVAGMKARALSAKFKEHVSQAQLFFNSLSEIEKIHLTNALAFELDHCDDPLVYNRMGERLAEIDLGLAQTVAQMVGAPIPEKAARKNHGHKAPNLSQMDFHPKKPTIKSRSVALIIADGYDPVAFTAIKAALTNQQAIPVVIGTRRSEIFPAGAPRTQGSGVKPDHHLEGFRSTLVDAVFVSGGEQSVKTLKGNGRAVHWVREAFGHNKPIAGTGEGIELLDVAFGNLPGVKLSNNSETVETYGVVSLKEVKPDTLKEAFEIGKEAVGFMEKFFLSISKHREWQRELDGLSAQVAY